MGRVFRPTKFSYYLGEQRPIDGIIIGYVDTNPPTPSPTPSNTPTPSVTPTFTPTPSVTPTLTPTSSPVTAYNLQAENSDFILAENGNNINIQY